MGNTPEQERIKDRCNAPADRPARLCGPYSPSAKLGPDLLSNEQGADGPFAAEAQSLDPAHDKELFKSLRESAEEGKDGKPDNRPFQTAWVRSAGCRGRVGRVRSMRQVTPSPASRLVLLISSFPSLR
jgi:hypothetical protein